MNASVRDNVLFGLPFNARRYQKVLEAACLVKVCARVWPRPSSLILSSLTLSLSLSAA
jgi:hypothetical protein